MAGKQINVGWGKINVIWDEDGISYLSLPALPGEEIDRPIADSSGDLPGLEQNLIDYFQGKPVDFSYKINLKSLTPFQQEVLEAVKMIPYGETRTYLWLAKQIGAPRAARAVGGALGKNPVAILVP
ncbi:MAG TPA: methylated-DNA--[protein]-cysteine S-methyltransferase [Clostridia bacterium]|nr:methylated-DNA--[protein]-cysteine S-methyltransferase [Clostridia bacterium]